MRTNIFRVLHLWLRLSIVALAVLLPTMPACGQTILQSWEGIRGPSPGVGPPPDPHGAPGPAGILATVNLRVSYYSKAGTLVWGPTNLTSFFVGNTGAGNDNADPKVVFDADSRRFFVIMQENHDSHFWLDVAVSRSSDPRTSGAGDWITYRLDATEYAGGNPVGGINYGGDFPGVAVDIRALYATYRMFSFDPNGKLDGGGGTVTNLALLIMNKAQLLSGNGTLASVYFGPANSPDAQAVTPIGTDPGNVAYVATIWDSSNVRLYAVSDPLGARTLSSQFISTANRPFSPTNSAPQLGSGNLLDTISGRTLGNASLVGGDVWFCSTRGSSSGIAAAAYYRLRLNGWPASGSVTLAEEGVVGDSAYWNFAPAIGVNLHGDAAMTWTRSSTNTYPTMMCASRTTLDSAFGAPQVVQASTFANNDGRWGDWFSVWPDPNDGSFWIVSEWSRINTGTWSTWWAQIQMPAQDFYVNLNAPTIGQDGSFLRPYVTVGTANANITRGAMHIYGGHYNEQIILNKTVTLDNYGGGGTVFIGAP